MYLYLSHTILGYTFMSWIILEIQMNLKAFKGGLEKDKYESNH